MIIPILWVWIIRTINTMLKVINTCKGSNVGCGFGRMLGEDLFFSNKSLVPFFEKLEKHGEGLGFAGIYCTMFSFYRLPCVVGILCNVNKVLTFLCLGVYVHSVISKSHFLCFEILKHTREI